MNYNCSTDEIDKKEIFLVNGTKIINLIYPDQFTLMWACMRPTEFIDSPDYSNKAFTKEEFLKNYKPIRSNSYFEDWNGVNLSQERILVWLDKINFVIDESEEQLLSLALGCNWRNNLFNKFSLSASHKKHENVNNVLKHELAHAVYSDIKEYRDLADSITDLSIYNDYKLYLENEGYCKNVTPDECQAYILVPSLRLKSPPIIKEHVELLNNSLNSFIKS